MDVHTMFKLNTPWEYNSAYPNQRIFITEEGA
jgi:hypothetical protein